MKALIVISVMLLATIACSDNDREAFVQEQEIPLASPKIETSSAIIDSSVMVTANLRMEGVKIFYTSDGTEPTTKSLPYSNPLKVKDDGVYTFKAFHPSWKASDPALIKLYKKGIAASGIEWMSGPGNTYPGVGDHTLINHQKGPLNFRDQQWHGFDSTASAEVRFKEKTYIENLTIGYLVDQNSWIFPPGSVSLYIDGIEITQIDFDETKQMDSAMLGDIVIPIGKELNSLKVEITNAILPEWHPGSGNKAWIFMDEWIFN